MDALAVPAASRWPSSGQDVPNWAACWPYPRPHEHIRVQAGAHRVYWRVLAAQKPNKGTVNTRPSFRDG